MKLFNYIIFLSLLCMNIVACSDNNEPGIPNIPEIPVPGTLKDGITRISDDSLAFVLFAPKKQTVHIIGDFNDWTVSDKYKMKKDGDRFWIKIGELSPDKEYICQYLIDEQIRIADPYSNKVSDPYEDLKIPASVYPGLIRYPTGKTTEIASVVTTTPGNYHWKHPDFVVNSTTNLNIYEILIRDFTESRSINGVKEKIPYLKSLGINAIELMPFNEFEGNDSWGYNPSFYFATDKAYGTANDYKAFIDECHSNGIAVIMDIVLNHSYGQSPMVRMYQDKVTQQPTADNPWYNQKSNFQNPDAQWGCDFNHESTYTRQFVDSVCAFWMSEYKIDGFRFDFTKGFSNTIYPNSGASAWGSPYDKARINNLKRINNEIKKRKSSAFMICEHLSEGEEEKELAEAGILLWGNINYNMNEATMGWIEDNKTDCSWGSYLYRGWTKPHLVTYMESHDEERLMFKNKAYGKENGNYNVKNLSTGLARCEAAAVILLAQPGPKMIWQFGELGYDYELGGDRLGMKPIRWDYYDVPQRKALFDTYAKMFNLRKNNPVFSTSEYSAKLVDPVKQVLLKSEEKYICAVANFDTETKIAILELEKQGKWIDYFSGKEINASTGTYELKLQPGEYYLWMN